MRILRSHLFVTLLSIISLHLNAQDQTTEADFLDFWIGDWNASWVESDSTMGKGHNRIEKLWNSNVVSENFEVLEGRMSGFEGKSYSCIDKNAGIWKQTWVDNQNAYLDFESTLVDGNPCFKREFSKDGQKVIQRMVFHDIEQESFIWDWEVSRDGGKTWQLNWQIFYERATD